MTATVPNVRAYDQHRGGDISFHGTLLVHDDRSGLDAYLTQKQRIAVVDIQNSDFYSYDSFDEFAEDCGDEPRFVKAVARCLNTEPPADHDRSVTPSDGVGGAQTPTTSHTAADAQSGSAGGGSSTPSCDQDWIDTHTSNVAGGSHPSTPEYIDGRLVLVSRELAVLAERVHALEEFREACANQHQALTDTKVHKDGKYRGQHLPAEHPVAIHSAVIVEEIQKIEDRFVKELQREIKKSPLWPWMKAQKGLGPKTIARLLASTGDPYWNDLHGRPRTVSELWSFCGYRPGQKKAKGQQMNWSPEAKMRAHVVVEPIIKMILAPCYRIYKDGDVEVKVFKSKDAPAGSAYVRGVHIEGGCSCSPYRVLWDEARAKYRDSVHPEDCVRCGPKGKPALAGSVRSAKHQMAMANRIVKKAILRDLWREAKRLHEQD